MKKILFTCLFTVLIVYAFFFPETIVEAAKDGILIWFNQILPTLLPFTILSSILIKSNFLKSFKGNANLIAVILTISCGFVFGFPVGAKLSADFYKQNLLTEQQATFLSIATNNFSPMYTIGFALPMLFSTNQWNNISYLLIYFLPLFIVTCLLLVSYHTTAANIPSDDVSHKKTTSRFRLNMQIMDDGIISGFESLIKICGYIVIFSILSHTLTNLWANPPYIWTFLLENLEITNGIALLSAYKMRENKKYIAAIQLLSFGGLSGIAQTSSILANSGLSTRKYIIGKAILSLLLTLFSATYMFFIH